MASSLANSHTLMDLSSKPETKEQALKQISKAPSGQGLQTHFLRPSLNS